jgi:hypothetical protein
VQARKTLKRQDHALAELHAFLDKLQRVFSAKRKVYLMNRILHHKRTGEPHNGKLAQLVQSEPTIECLEEEWKRVLLYCLYNMRDINEFLDIKNLVLATMLKEDKVLSDIKPKLNGMSAETRKRTKIEVTRLALRNMKKDSSRQATLISLLKANLHNVEIDEEHVFWRDFMALVGHELICQQFEL